MVSRIPNFYESFIESETKLWLWLVGKFLKKKIRIGDWELVNPWGGQLKLKRKSGRDLGISLD